MGRGRRASPLSSCPGRTLALPGGAGGMKEFDFHLLRHAEAQLQVIAQILVQGRDIYDAMDRAALALNVRARLAPDVLVFTVVQGPRQEQVRPGDLLVGGGLTARVLSLNDFRSAPSIGRILLLH